MNALSEREHLVAEQYCKGLADKEVADKLGRSTWTIKAQKRDIYRKLGISKDTELVLYLFCEKLSDFKQMLTELIEQGICDFKEKSGKKMLKNCGVLSAPSLSGTNRG